MASMWPVFLALWGFLVPVVGLLGHFWLLLGRSGVAFGHFGVAPGRSWALLGASWPLLGVFGAPFGCSWGALGRIMPLMDAPDLDFRGSGRVPAGFGGFCGASFGHTFCMLTLVSYHALNAALNPRWHLLWLLLSYLKRGGTCAAHGIPLLGADTHRVMAPIARQESKPSKLRLS